MRILIVSQYYWPEGFLVNDVARSLAAKGHVVEVVTGKPNYPYGKVFAGYSAFGRQRQNHQGVTINRLPLVPRGKGGWRLMINYFSFILSGLLFAPAMVRGKEFDVVFVYAPSPILQAIPAIYLGWLHKSPVLLWVQDLWPESLVATGYVKNRQLLNLVGKIVRFIYHHVDLLLVQSKAFIAPVRCLAGETPIVYCPNSVDDSFTQEKNIDNPDVRRLLSGFTVLFAGNIGTAQGIDVIVDVAERLQEYKEINFVLLGDGSCRQQIINEVQGRGLTNVNLPGRFPLETMPAFMQQAQALLVTLTDQPIFALTVPNKVQAYMAAGRPILASLNGEGGRLVEETGAGFSSPAEDAAALADNILRLYRLSEEERNMMGQQGRSYFQRHFSQERLIDRLLGFFRQVTGRGEGQ